jgi:selenoprotein W-related protein
LPNASSLEEYLKGKHDAEIELISSGGGVFEVCLEDKLIFSKKSLGRFPEHSEIDDLINQNLN